LPSIRARAHWRLAEHGHAIGRQRKERMGKKNGKKRMAANGWGLWDSEGRERAAGVCG